MSIALSQYGKILRKLRIDNNDNGVQFADKMGVKSTVVSLIERGRYKIPKGFTERVAKMYKLTKEQIDELVKAEERQLMVVQFVLDGCDSDAYDAIVALSKKIADNPRVTKKELKSMINGIFS